MRLAEEDGSDKHQQAGPKPQRSKPDPPDPQHPATPAPPHKRQLQPLGVHPGLNLAINTASMPTPLASSMLLSFPPEPPSQRKGAAKACAVKGAKRQSEATRTLDRIASRERRNRSKTRREGMTEIPPGGLEQRKEKAHQDKLTWQAGGKTRLGCAPKRTNFLSAGFRK